MRKSIATIAYWKADQELHDLIYRVLREKRPNIVQLKPEIVCIFKDIASVQGGKIDIALIRKVSEKDRVVYNSDIDFVLEIGSNVWYTLNDSQKEAIIFHELLHIDIKPEDGTFILRKHDVEEFSSVVVHYGFYKSDVQDFARSVLEVESKGIVKKRPIERCKLSR